MTLERAEYDEGVASPAPTRERILDAFELLLIDDGERAATLEAVASNAGVSKGGLLYHFASKDALIQGLIERLRVLVSADVERMRAAPEGVVEYFIRTSVASTDLGQSALERAIVACACLAQGSHADVRDAIRSMQATWLAAITDAVTDPVAARVVALVGDGLYFNSSMRLTDETARSESMDELVAAVKDFVARRSGPAESSV
ncbi:TetR/AcrR family transcriptional regulator [Rathayibacter soli]|uniref:TetR/AcrR family transcriptional regulator n=1 Tax=Rathayibacter soli TaxID=3144168 RepID=UPI0027E59A8F|nr:TetR/AcrR family transcriptional regulator [Glaciibacter superstes]